MFPFASWNFSDNQAILPAVCCYQSAVVGLLLFHFVTIWLVNPYTDRWFTVTLVAAVPAVPLAYSRAVLLGTPSTAFHLS